MYINPNSGIAELEIKEIRYLIEGKFDFRICLDCNGKGIVLVDGDAGIVVESIAKDRDKSDFYYDMCDECSGLGGFLRLSC